MARRIQIRLRLRSEPFADWEGAFRAISENLASWKGRFSDFVALLDKKAVPYLSFSKISTFDTCEHRYWLEYVQRVKLDEQPAYFAKGSAFHAAANIAHRQISEGKVNIDDLLKWVRRRHRDHEVHFANALRLLIENAPRGYEIVATEHPFVLSLGPGLPPLVGVIDLLLRKGQTLLIIDHKTGRDLYDQDDLQLLLYRQYVRAAFNPKRCLACFDEYRWVNNLDRIRKPAFRRTHLRAADGAWPRVLWWVRGIYDRMRSVESSGETESGGNCLACPFKDVCERAVASWGATW